MFKKDSLKKTLLMNYPGCKSAVDAFELTKLNLSQRPSETSKEYKSMRQAIIDIELSLNGFDIDEMDSFVRGELRDLPLKTLGGIEVWKEGWMKAIRKLGKD